LTIVDRFIINYSIQTMTSADPDAPLSLPELKRWMSEEVNSWIQEGDEKEAQLEQEMEDNAAYNVSNLF
jgi:hypothetical protein